MLRIAAHVFDHLTRYSDQFARAEPYKHLAIDEFFEPDFAEELLRDFPVFDPSLAKNEIYEGVWGKAVNTKIREISPTYEELYALIGSPEFLELMSQMTGIPDLLLDPRLYGGGTHENRHGQSLDAHVDFNYDEAQKLHRRLNLIVYLNKDWRAEWGGSLEVHSNPRRPKENRIWSYVCSFNRAIVFETNEHSWHGFPEVDLPEAERHRSRKSLSIYLYTRERPAHEVAPVHGTFYVHRPLPERFAPGYTLTEADVKLLNFDVDRRDRWIEIYQKMELARNGELDEKAAYTNQLLRLVRAPITGYALQVGESAGLYAEGWVRGHVELRVRPLQPVTGLAVKGWRPEYAPEGAEIKVRVDGVEFGSVVAGAGVFEVVCGFEVAVEAEYLLSVDCDVEFQAPGDSRELAFVLIEVSHRH